MSKGFLILISGIVLLIGTLVWIYIDNKNKEIREQELLKKASTINANINKKSTVSINEDTEIIGDSTELLCDSTELLNDTEII